MAHTLTVGDNGILYSKFIGDVDQEAIQEFINSITPHLEHATADNPLQFVADASEEGTWNLSARREFTQLFDNEPRLGRVAITNANRFIRVVATFMMKATGRDGAVRFFENDEQALEWLQS